ncbi:MAG: glycine C-acetyltransferase [Cyanobacteria bacterium]|nr:glycine C-acetyltransferase [Cyanobacteriota bacterium]
MTSTNQAETPQALKSHRLDFLEAECQELKEQHLFQSLRVMSSAQGAKIQLDGKSVINLSSNNYLGLNTHPKLITAAKKAIDDYGVGTGSVRTIIGTMDIHQAFEKRLAQFKHTEATLVLQSGFTANNAAVTSILGEGDVVISDSLNHASIIDACRLLKKVPRYVYAHADMTELEARLKETQSARRRLVVTDGVFSMDGDIAPLPEIVALCEQYNAIVMVDDAHASGVFGKNGRGTVDHFNLHGRVDIQIGTLSKAIGALGGYVACTQAMRDIMINRARPFLFSTSAPPSVVMTCMAALDLLETDTALIDQLWYNTRYFKAGLKSIGYNVQSDSPIIPVIAGTSEKAHRLSERLFEEGVYVRSIVYPTVALDKARVRVILSATHTQTQLDQAIAAFEKVGKELDLIGP